MTPYILKGSFDLHITDYCNLHCKGCTVLDYLESGLVTNEKNNLGDVQKIISNLQKYNLKLEQLVILGGEPTLHKQLGDIIDFLKSTGVIENLAILTNGLNLTDSVVESLMKLDRIIISVYPFKNKESLDKVIQQSELGKLISSQIKVDYWLQDKFQKYGEGQPNVLYSQELNWKRCYQKDSCRVITDQGLFRCAQIYNEKKEMCSWENKEEIINYIESDIPLEQCRVCPWPPKEMDWSSNNMPVDERNYLKGMELITNCQQKTLDFVKNYS
tara:strand:- start:457 stop:1272 length:816 start_codon:yes stop_codon:yes gene_type:complete